MRGMLAGCRCGEVYLEEGISSLAGSFFPSSQLMNDILQHSLTPLFGVVYKQIHISERFRGL